MSNEMKEWLRDKEMEKKYVVDESTLIELLNAEMWKDCLDRDGVDNWVYCGASYQEVLRDYLPEGEDCFEDDSFYDVIKKRLAAGEFEEYKENG